MHEEVGFLVELSFDQAVADQKFARSLRIDRTEPHAPAGHDRQPEKRDPFDSHRRRGGLVPLRIAVRPLDQVAGQGFDPTGIDFSTAAQIAARGFNHFRGDDPFRATLEHARAGPDISLAAAGDGVFVSFAFLGQAREQSGENRPVDGGVFFGRSRRTFGDMLGAMPTLAVGMFGSLALWERGRG